MTAEASAWKARRLMTAEASAWKARRLGRLALLLTALATGACREPESDPVQHAVDPDEPTPNPVAETSGVDAGSQLPAQPAPTPSAGSDDAGDDAANALVPPECPGLGFEYALGCDDCPNGTLTCPCNAYPETSGSEATSFQLGCSYGTCLANVSCEVFCAAVIERPADSFLSTFSCPSERTCAAQSDCGDGYCYGETPDRRGSCSAGADGEDCFDPGDCRGGFCGPRGCTSGQPDALCTTEADCAAGKCIGNVDVDGFGFCSTGADNEKCKTDDDCAAELFCHTGITRCIEGVLRAPCQKDEQCNSGACGFGNCINGELGEDCDADDDCSSGHCRRPEVPTGLGIPGTCISGAAGEACYFDDDCESAHCLSVAHDVEGVCTDRAPGDRCFDAADCASGSCTERSQVPSSDCEQPTDAGVPCESTGICIDGAMCSARTCD